MREKQNILTSQPCLHTLMRILLSANQGVHTILVILYKWLTSNFDKFPILFLQKAETQVAPSESTGKEVSYEWPHHRIFETPSLILRSKFEFSFVAPIFFISHSSSGEKLIKYQATSSRLIMSVILMTSLFYKALIFQREI